MAQNTKTGITYKEYNEKLRIPEQEQAEHLLMKHKHFVLGFEPGKGKSYPVIHCVKLVEKLKGRPLKVLVMSDATAIKSMWKTDIMPQANPDSIAEKLRTSGFTEDDYLKKPELLVFTKLEANAGKKLFNELCKDYIVKT